MGILLLQEIQIYVLTNQISSWFFSDCNHFELFFNQTSTNSESCQNGKHMLQTTIGCPFSSTSLMFLLYKRLRNPILYERYTYFIYLWNLILVVWRMQSNQEEDTEDRNVPDTILMCPICYKMSHRLLLHIANPNCFPMFRPLTSYCLPSRLRGFRSMMIKIHWMAFSTL